MTYSALEDYILLRKKLQRYSYLLSKEEKTKEDKAEISTLERFQERLLTHIKDVYDIVYTKKMYNIIEERDKFFTTNCIKDL